MVVSRGCGCLIILLALSGVLSSVEVEFPDGSSINKEYKLEYNLKANWYKALLYCRNQGMELATITTKEEQEELNKLIIQSGVNTYSFWLGGTDLAEHGRFSWVANGRPVTYSNWQPTDPNNPGSCIELYIDQRWVDSYCHRERFFVCERTSADMTDTMILWRKNLN